MCSRTDSAFPHSELFPVKLRMVSQRKHAPIDKTRRTSSSDFLFLNHTEKDETKTDETDSICDFDVSKHLMMSHGVKTLASIVKKYNCNNSTQHIEFLFAQYFSQCPK